MLSVNDSAGGAVNLIRRQRGSNGLRRRISDSTGRAYELSSS